MTSQNQSHEGRAKNSESISQYNTPFKLNKLTKALSFLSVFSMGLTLSSAAFAQTGDCNAATAGFTATCSGAMTETIEKKTNDYDIIITTDKNFSIKTTIGDAVTLVNQQSDRDDNAVTHEISFIQTGTGTIIGAENGIYIENKSGGSTILNAQGEIIGKSGNGVEIHHMGDTNIDENMNITVGDVTGATNGVVINAQTFGKLELTSSGKIVGKEQSGIFIAPGFIVSGIKLNVHDVSGATNGIDITDYPIPDPSSKNPDDGFSTYLQGKVTVDTTGEISGGANGINIEHMGLDVEINILKNSTVIGQNDGINVEHYGMMAGVNEDLSQSVTQILIDIAGKVSGADGTGINTLLGDNNGSTIKTDISIQKEGFVEGVASAITMSGYGGESSLANLNNAGTIQNINGSSKLAVEVTSGILESNITNTGTIIGTVNLNAQNSNTVTNSSIWDTAGGTNTFSGTSSVINNSGKIVAAKTGVLSETFFNGLTTFNNTGNIDMQNGKAGDVTTIDGNYVGAGGYLLVDSEWNNPDVQKNDKLIITGSSSGSTTVSVTGGKIIGNVTLSDIEKNGGWSAPVIIINGEDSTTRTFKGSAQTSGVAEAQLVRRYNAEAESYEYTWTLRSQSDNGNTGGSNSGTHNIYSSVVSGYVNMPRANMELGYATLGILHERRGENQMLAWDECASCVEGTEQTWTRILGHKVKQNGKSRLGLDTEIYGFQIGHDLAVQRNEKGGHRLTGGYISYGYAKTKFSDQYRAENGYVVGDKHTGKGTTESFSIGVTNTYYTAEGSYLDLVGQLSYLHNKYEPRDNKTVSQNGWGAILSAEVGRPFILSEQDNKNVAWLIEPQAQLIYQYVKLKSFNDGFRHVDQGNQQGLRGRVGFRLSYNEENNYKRTDSYYMVANVWHDFTNPRAISIGQDRIKENFTKTWGEIGLGVQKTVSDNSHLYADVRYMRNFGSKKRDGYRATIGYKYTW